MELLLSHVIEIAINVVAALIVIGLQNRNKKK